MCSYVLSVHVSCKLLAYTYSAFSAVRNGEAGLFVATQTGQGDHFWVATSFTLVRKTTVAKFGPATTSFDKMGPFLATKSGLGGPFLVAKISPGDHFWVEPILA